MRWMPLLPGEVGTLHLGEAYLCTEGQKYCTLESASEMMANS